MACYRVTSGLDPNRALTIEAEGPRAAAQLALPMLFGLTPNVRVDLITKQGMVAMRGMSCPAIYQIRYYTIRPFLKFFRRRAVVEDPRFTVTVEASAPLEPHEWWDVREEEHRARLEAIE